MFHSTQNVRLCLTSEKKTSPPPAIPSSFFPVEIMENGWNWEKAPFPYKDKTPSHQIFRSVLQAWKSKLSITSKHKDHE